MAKYRGKHEGKTRGKYTCMSFESGQKDKDQNNDFAGEVNYFLYKKGYQVTHGTEFKDEKRSYTTSSYHVAGASVGVTQRDTDKEEHKKMGCYKSPPNFTRIKLVSNDNLDDVIEMILDEFPSFKECDFDFY